MLRSEILSFNDPYAYQQAVFSGKFELFVTAAGHYTADLTRISLHRLLMQRSRESLARVAHAAVTPGRVVVFFLTDPQQEPHFHSGLEVPPEHIVVCASGSEYHRRASSETRWGAISLTTDDLARAGATVTGRALPGPASSRLLRPPPALMSRLLRLHEAAGQLAANAPEILAHPEVARAIELELVRTIVHCLSDSATVPVNASPQLRLSVMRRFEHMLVESGDQPLYLTEVCATLGVAERTLRHYCQDQLGMGPRRYLWLRRMHSARQALALADAEAATVTMIANERGFGELGRFAVAYQRLFGEPPSATLRRTPQYRPVFVHGSPFAH
jgi:AraC-like DNA-binding protein